MFIIDTENKFEDNDILEVQKAYGK
jgi:hypothetical protein